jgi:Flagellar P-ring protein
MVGRRLAAFTALLSLCAGCMHEQFRSQKADDADRDAESRTIGDLTSVSNAAKIPVIGVGLVTGLADTGGGVPPGNERAQLENELKKLEVSNISELFTSKTTSLVRVQAEIPAGAKKGEPVDIFVTVPDFCRTTSLRGGKLEMCWLYSFESSQNLSTDPSKPDRLLRGHALVKASGPVLAGLPVGDDQEPSQKFGKVWGGGKTLVPDRPFVLEVNPPSVKAAMGIATRINETFHGPGGSAAPIAVAKNDTHVILSVPGPYRLNLERFLRVVRLIPLDGSLKTDGPYVKKLNDQLLDSERCVTAALRLEALGVGSIPMLKLGMQSENEMVRFSSAEALAYLGSPACAEELAKQAEEHPFVQAYALTALASLNESICRTKLNDLLGATAPEVRYGAFRALRALDDHDPLVQGEKIGGTFALHRVAWTTQPQIHASTGKRAEVVLYGQGPAMLPPFSFLAGPEFMLTAKAGDSECTLSRYSSRYGKQSKQCPLDVGDVLKSLGEMGGTYVDALELLRQADGVRALNCAVMFDALPKVPTVRDMLAHGKTGRAGGKDAESNRLVPVLYDDANTNRDHLTAVSK